MLVIFMEEQPVIFRALDKMLFLIHVLIFF